MCYITLKYEIFWKVCHDENLCQCEKGCVRKFNFCLLFDFYRYSLEAVSICWFSCQSDTFNSRQSSDTMVYNIEMFLISTNSIWIETFPYFFIWDDPQNTQQEAQQLRFLAGRLQTRSIMQKALCPPMSLSQELIASNEWEKCRQARLV